jgi:Ala-tRNA(Pro) deacylase
MIARRFIEFLDTFHAKYELISHPVAYTAWETASRSHVPEEKLAKTVILKLDGAFVMVVLPASRHVNIAALGAAAKARTVRLASESEFKKRFPDCEVGAMPPFGNLYGIPVLVDASLAQEDEIVFNACSHSELMRMSYADFAELTKPTVLEFSAEGEHALYLDDRLW